MQLAVDTPFIPPHAISPTREMGAYEALWLEDGATFRRLAQRFETRPDALPSAFVSPERADEAARDVRERLLKSGTIAFDVCVNGMDSYPGSLRDAKHPIELFYYRGWLNLVESPLVAVVGTRKPSEAGRQRARQLATKFVEDGWTVISGLAAGIDTEAHQAAIAAGGNTVAVIGTPISHSYPVENHALQELIARKHLLLSQIPILRYESQQAAINRFFFPQRNITMSALSKATVIVEASESSGTLVQAREALRQGRKLFILDSCFDQPGLTWPARFVKEGAIRVRSFDDIREQLDQTR